ncbi:hypothetical protein [uncultured Sulfitobacter sp.]|uniref:hypothetical protein n=1 Tax=uncultured Sulfitobacter sp. TaxID=191468 RepID=UPI0026049947|nr:hypothetical protein [uncultured Sulfitobacter sp.]
MDIFLPKGFEPGRARAPMSRPARTQRLCVEAGGVYYPVLRRWATGFAVAAGDAPELHGLVNLYDGATHLHECLVTGHEAAGGEMIFTVKKSSGVDYTAAAHIGDDVKGQSARG